MLGARSCNVARYSVDPVAKRAVVEASWFAGAFVVGNSVGLRRFLTQVFLDLAELFQAVAPLEFALVL